MRRTPSLVSYGHFVGSESSSSDLQAADPPFASVPLLSFLWVFVSDDFQNVTGHETSLLSTWHSDEAAAFALATHTNLREKICYFNVQPHIKKKNLSPNISTNVSNLM